MNSEIQERDLPTTNLVGFAAITLRDNNGAHRHVWHRTRSLGTPTAPPEPIALGAKLLGRDTLTVVVETADDSAFHRVRGTVEMLLKADAEDSGH